MSNVKRRMFEFAIDTLTVTSINAVVLAAFFTVMAVAEPSPSVSDGLGPVEIPSQSAGPLTERVDPELEESDFRQDRFAAID